VVTAATIGVIAIVNSPLAVALVAEHSLVESLQVALLAAGGLLTARYAWNAARTGRPVALEIAIVTAIAMACISEVDLDRLLFGTKIIAKRFFLSAKTPLALRVLAFLAVVGVPAAVGIWLLMRWRTVRNQLVSALREPWGQTVAFGLVLYAMAQTLERPIDKISWNPHHLLEEAAELVAALCMFIALAARHGLGTRHILALRRSVAAVRAHAPDKRA
jgi:hypothetical protein